ncbi:MAG: hypothetical protein JJU06_18375 [Ectothiorhodospiraceae bacterium]|nr:hypothetical protein [Ectothiorhodospiraceae bacterium]MCH8506179.1 hypothetical protein [Ectothiorhodospiraceae bacterium]
MSNLAHSHTPRAGQTDVIEAPMLETTLARLEPDQRSVVFDLGAASASTLSCFANGRCRITFADAVESLLALDDTVGRDALASRIDSLLPRAPEAPATLILCWDLPNFLSRPVLRALMEGLTERSAGGALFHQFIAYPSRAVPTRPGRYSLRKDGKVLRQISATETGVLPVLPMRDLEHIMPGCHLVRSVLLGSGMQDCLFRYGGPD